jgi:CheY-like chemotaxis protein
MRVIDNGGGLSPEAQRHVFEPFFGTTRWDAGAGLGLAAVYGIVRSLGGTVTVDSDPSHGTTCSVYLRPVPAEDSPRATGPRSVLVVDGDIAILELAARLLRNAKFEVHTAASGESALAILEAEGPRVGVMLADLKLPDTSIADLVAAARACQIDLACVVMSGYGSRAAATAVGLPVVPKPFELDELVRTIDDALRRTEE